MDDFFTLFLIQNQYVMKTIQLISFLFCSFFYSQIYTQCADPTIQIVSDCGTEFDLCLDNYTTGVDEGILLEIFLNDDLGIFDPCESDTLSGTSNGVLTQLPDCNWFYVPNSGFTGKDTFFYILNYLDVCVTQCYCSSDPGCLDGRIWTIDALYLGEDFSNNSSYDPTVLVKDKNGVTFSTHENLSFGDEFFADGSSLLPSTTNYEYQLFLDGDTTHVADQVELVHVSCSQEVFGVTFGFLRPISGCIAPTSQSLSCAGVGNNLKSEEALVENRNLMGDLLTVATADTTIVIITIEQSLPVEVIAFNGRGMEKMNLVSWSLNNYGSALVELQRSTNGKEFEAIYSFVPEGTLVQGAYEDEKLYASQYYRLAIYDHNGEFNYSAVINITNPYSSPKEIQIYPNPFQDSFVLTLADNTIHTVRVLNSSGKIVQVIDNHLNNENHEILFNKNLKSGLYFIHIIGEGISETHRVLKI